MTATEAHEHAPFIDYENLPAPTEGFVVTLFITVRSVARSRAFTPRSSAARWCWRRTRASSSSPTHGC